MLLGGLKRSLCLLKKVDTDQLDNEEMELTILATLLMRHFESDGVTFYLLSFLLDSQYSKKLIDSRNSLYQAVFSYMKIAKFQRDQWPDKLRRQFKAIAEQVANYPTVEQALDLLNGETETTTRTCRLYLLNVNQIGDIRDRKFYTVCGDIIGEDGEGVEI